jgi:biopolymer transport protein ExbB/TolQ
MKKLAFVIIVIVAVVLFWMIFISSAFAQAGPSAYQWQQNQRIAEQQIMQRQQLQEMQRQTRALEDMARQQQMNNMNRGLYQPPLMQPSYR